MGPIDWRLDSYDHAPLVFAPIIRGPFVVLKGDDSYIWGMVRDTEPVRLVLQTFQFPPIQHFFKGNFLTDLSEL